MQGRTDQHATLAVPICIAVLVSSAGVVLADEDPSRAILAPLAQGDDLGGGFRIAEFGSSGPDAIRVTIENPEAGAVVVEMTRRDDGEPGGRGLLDHTCQPGPHPSQRLHHPPGGGPDPAFGSVARRTLARGPKKLFEHYLYGYIGGDGEVEITRLPDGRLPYQISTLIEYGQGQIPQEELESKLATLLRRHGQLILVGANTDEHTLPLVTARCASLPGGEGLALLRCACGPTCERLGK